MADPAYLATLRLCERADCEFTVLNAITDLKDILLAMSNHIASKHPAADGSEGGGAGGAKSNAPIPTLDTDVTEADLHRIVQNRGEAPERYAARIHQAAPPFC